MYAKRFGLKQNPFRSIAEGSGVFVGPQQAKVITSLQKALQGPDSVLVVSGPVGVGKTTLVMRALESNKRLQVVARVGRMRLAPDELLLMLLNGFGITRQPRSTVQRFAAFRRMLNERAAADTRVIIVIEDALRVGDDALLELEALTATDSGIAVGANIILMGPPETAKHFQQPELARLQQRARRTQTVEPFNRAEVQGYLEHCMRIAGVDCAGLFDEGAANMLCRLSGGIPRIINNICDATLTAATRMDLDRISPQFLQEIAADEFGLEGTSQTDTDGQTDSALEPSKKIADIDTSVSATAPQADIRSQPEPETTSPDVELQVTAKDDAPIEDTGSNIPPEFQPDADIGLVESALGDPVTEPDTTPDTATTNAPEEKTESSDTVDHVPTLSSSMLVEIPKKPEQAVTLDDAVNPSTEVTVDQPIPDLDALEAAISAARAGGLATQDNRSKSPGLPQQAAPAAPNDTIEVPSVAAEITLDKSIEAQRNNRQKLDKMATELANANSLEDISDVVAETLFGTEFERIAAEALAHSPANDADGASPANTVPPAAAATSQPPAVPEAGNDQSQASISQTFQELDQSRQAEKKLSAGDSTGDDKSDGLIGRLKKSLES